MIYYVSNSELYHFGIKGQKWGVRRFENENGELTAAGKARYNEVDGKYQKLKGGSSKTSSSSDQAKSSKELYSHLKKNQGNSDNEMIKKRLTDDHRNRLSKAHDEYQRTVDAQVAAENRLNRKYAEKIRNLNKERGMGKVTTKDSKQAWKDTLNENKDDAKLYKSKADKIAYDAYENEAKKIASEMLGKYGDIKINETYNDRTYGEQLALKIVNEHRLKRL